MDTTKRDTFGRLTLTGNSRRERIKGKLILLVEVKCVCGAIKEVRLCNLRLGMTNSCGCLRKELSSARLRTHGESTTTLYRRWGRLFIRCKGNKPRDKKTYTDRGISVCERWENFLNFKEDMGEPPSVHHSIDRIDNDKGYSPENCRWATAKEQCNNKRNNSEVTFGGRTQTYAMWARELGVGPKALRYRIAVSGWSVEKALTVPMNHANKKETHGV